MFQSPPTSCISTTNHYYQSLSPTINPLSHTSTTGCTMSPLTLWEFPSLCRLLCNLIPMICAQKNKTNDWKKERNKQIHTQRKKRGNKQHSQNTETKKVKIKMHTMHNQCKTPIVAKLWLRSRVFFLFACLLHLNSLLFNTCFTCKTI